MPGLWLWWVVSKNARQIRRIPRTVTSTCIGAVRRETKRRTRGWPESQWSASSCFVEVRHVWPYTVPHFRDHFSGKKRENRIFSYILSNRPCSSKISYSLPSYSFKLFPFLSPIFANESLERKFVID